MFKMGNNQMLYLVLLIAVVAFLFYYFGMRPAYSNEGELTMNEEDQMTEASREAAAPEGSEENMANPAGDVELTGMGMPGNVPGVGQPYGGEQQLLANGNPFGVGETPETSLAQDTAEKELRQTSCWPKSQQLTPGELLPQDCSTAWAQSHPAGCGTLQDKNFLQAGHHVGINTVGQTLRNANLQLRSEPPNPQVRVSPWIQSTIMPDTNRRYFEVGSC